MTTTRPLPPRRLADHLPLGREASAVRRRVETLEAMLERMFVIPGLGRPIGLDAMLSLLPVGGTTIAAALGGYLVWEARNIGMTRWQLLRMAGNIGFDWLLGMIPFVGAVPDFFFRSNTRNLRIIKRHLDKHHPATATLEG